MTGPLPPDWTVRFGIFEFDVRAGELRKRGARVPLQGLPGQLLTVLLENPGQVITREELRSRLWPADTFVDFDHSLHNAIARLREALGDSSGSPRFIETLPRKGYRFIGQFESKAPAQSGEGKTTVKSTAHVIGGRATLALALGAVVSALVLGALAYVNVQRQNALLRIHSLAVLPLENLSNDPDQEYFVDGMTDELITNLAKIGSLRVISRTSIMQYKKVRKPLQTIAHELNVDAIVEGTVARSGNHIRITARLIDAMEDRLLWAENYDREVGDAVTLQNQIAGTVANEISAKLTPVERAQLAASHSVNPAAYELYLKGRYFWAKRNEESLNRAMEYFSQAIDLDPNYAAPYSGLADSYVLFGMSFDVGGRPPGEVYPKARAAALKASELNAALSDAHNSLAFVKLNYDWDWPGAETEFKRALELNPGYAHAHHWYAHLLLSRGREHEALAESNRALELDPLSPIINLHLAWHYLYTRQYDRAFDQLAKTLELDPNYALAHWYRGLTYEQKKMYGEALREMAEAKNLLPGNLAVESDIGHVYAVSGNKAAAQKVIAALKDESAHRYVNLYELALIYVGLGQRDQAFESLDKAFRERSDQMIYLKVDPRLDSLRSDARFANLVLRVGIPK
jgi:TolB-like protein/DNA-binding winged helix-turn-helix (wHTH) protein/Tfp pilus assembly protein PilF